MLTLTDYVDLYITVMSNDRCFDDDKVKIMCHYYFLDTADPHHTINNT